MDLQDFIRKNRHHLDTGPQLDTHFPIYEFYWSSPANQLNINLSYQPIRPNVAHVVNSHHYEVLLPEEYRGNQAGFDKWFGQWVKQLPVHIDFEVISSASDPFTPATPPAGPAPPPYQNPTTTQTTKTATSRPSHSSSRKSTTTATKPSKPGAMDDAKLAAILNFPIPSSSGSGSGSGAPSSSSSSSSLAGKTLSSQYNAMMTKRGKRSYPKACEGPTKCKNVLCEHKFTPVGALTKSMDEESEINDPLLDPKVLSLVMAQSEKNGYLVSKTYAIKMLQKNQYKLVPAIKEIKADIEAREIALHSTGRVNVALEHYVQDTYIATTDSSNENGSSKPVVPQSMFCSPNCRLHAHVTGLPKTRDEFILSLETEDAHIAESLTQGWKSHYGKAIQAARYKTKEQREAAFKIYVDEAKYRDDRAEFWKETVAQGVSGDEVEVCMEKWDELHRGNNGGYAGPMSRSIEDLAGMKSSTAVSGSSTTPGAASTSIAKSAESSDDTRPKSKVYSHPLTEAPIINEITSLQPVVDEAPEICDDESGEPTEGEGIGKTSEAPIEFSSGWARSFSEFAQQQETDKARYEALMASVAEDDVKIATLRMQANQLLHENRKLQHVNWELKFRATQRLLEEIDDPPEPQIIYDLVTKIADWDLKFDIALGDDDLPILYSLELYDLLDKLCKNIYLVSVQTISEETRPAIRKAWEAIDFGGRAFFPAMKLAIIIDRGLMEDTLGDKLSKTLEMAMLLDETFKNLDIELPVLNRKAKRNRVEDKKLQGMLKQCLELSMKVCEYPTDLSWHGIQKLRYEVGESITLQKQMETKYIGLASSDPPTETMNKKNAELYLELIKKARDIDDLLKAKAEDPVAKYKQMLSTWYVDKVHPASVLRAWKTLIKDEETHNMIALLILIAADEEEGKFGQVIQLFREAIHEDLLALHKFVKNDPKDFCAKTNYKFLLEVVGDPGQLKWDDLTDQQIWDWVLGFQIAKTRLGVDVKDMLGWAAMFEGQKPVKIATVLPAVAKPMVQFSGSERRIVTPRRMQVSLRKALSKDAIEAKVGENETLEDAVERLSLGTKTAHNVDSHTDPSVKAATSNAASSSSTAGGSGDSDKLDSDQAQAGLDEATINQLKALGVDFSNPEVAKVLNIIHNNGVALGKAEGEKSAASSEPGRTEPALSEKAKGKQPARD